VPTDTPPEKTPQRIELVRPTDGLQIAYDPRIPKDHQHFRFEIKGVTDNNIIKWTLDNELVGQGVSPTMLWPVQKGQHTLSVQISNANDIIRIMPPVTFLVK
jgi:penicillin-binding protein 1C